MTDPFDVHGDLPSLEAPVLVVAMQGWIDASSAADAAMTHLRRACDARPLVTFDSDVFIDYRARRPVMEVREGVNTRLVWSDIEMSWGRDAAGHDLVLLTGPEPDAAWRAFARHVTTLAQRLGVRKMVGLGAYPFTTPHTRASRLSVTSPSLEVVERLAHQRSSVDAPAGVAALLEHALTDAGIPSLGLWVQVPHYLAASAYPPAVIALLDGLRDVADLVVDTTDLQREAAELVQRIDRLVAANDEHLTMLRQLEAAHDAIIDLAPERLPTGDDIAAEFERFLRDRDE